MPREDRPPLPNTHKYPWPDKTVTEWIKRHEAEFAVLQKKIAALSARPDRDGKPGQDGKPGTDGRGIKSAGIDAGGNLTLTLTDGSVVTAGKLPGGGGTPGAKGDAGANGKDGVGVEGISSENGNITFKLSDKRMLTFRLPKGDKGDPGVVTIEQYDADTGATIKTQSGIPSGSKVRIPVRTVQN